MPSKKLLSLCLLLVFFANATLKVYAFTSPFIEFSPTTASSCSSSIILSHGGSINGGTYDALLYDTVSDHYRGTLTVPGGGGSSMDGFDICPRINLNGTVTDSKYDIVFTGGVCESGGSEFGGYRTYSDCLANGGVSNLINFGPLFTQSPGGGGGGGGGSSDFDFNATSTVQILSNTIQSGAVFGIYLGLLLLFFATKRHD